jgi:hypothetical protein
MRLPAGSLAQIADTFLRDKDFALLGCLSFEARSCAVPEILWSRSCARIDLLDVIDPFDAFPDYSIEARRKIERNRRRLEKAKINFQSHKVPLLATEDQLLDTFDTLRLADASTIVMDITSLPKRYFCFFLKRLLLLEHFQNVVVTYTIPAPHGYTHDPLAEDPMSYDHLPGYAAALQPGPRALVVSVGFEALNIRNLLEVYSDKQRDIRFIFSFPPGGGAIRRQWDTLRRMGLDARDIDRENVEIIAAWDAEQVFKTLERWYPGSEALILAPFGVKSHSLGMALFALKHDSGLYYTQPKAYNPDYSRGQGQTMAYVVKWQGMACFNRETRRP